MRRDLLQEQNQYYKNMGKAEIQMRITMLEQMLETYIKLSESSAANKVKYQATLEKIRMQLASLYTQLMQK